MSVKFTPRKRKVPTKADELKAKNLLKRGGEVMLENEKRRKQEQRESQAQATEAPTHGVQLQGVEGRAVRKGG